MVTFTGDIVTFRGDGDVLATSEAQLLLAIASEVVLRHATEMIVITVVPLLALCNEQST